MESQPRRRKSRRHEERLREEHAAAVKKAREQDLAYRLGAFLPMNTCNEDVKTTLTLISMEWPPSLNVELTDEKFSISNESNEILLKTASFTFAAGSTSNTELSSSRLTSSDQTVHVMAPRVKCVTKRQISSFISERGGKSIPRGIMDWVRLYLNQCGQWSHLILENEAGKIHKVCM